MVIRMKSDIAIAIEALDLAVECGGDLDRPVFVQARDKLKALADKLVRYDQDIDDKEVSPDGSDYNEFALLIGIPALRGQL